MGPACLSGGGKMFLNACKVGADCEVYFSGLAIVCREGEVLVVVVCGMVISCECVPKRLVDTLVDSGVASAKGEEK